MNIDAMDAKLRPFELVSDYVALPELYLVARLDGRGFTKLTEARRYEKPFDAVFHKAMVDTAEHLAAGCGLKIRYAYTQSDEISLLMDRKEVSFNRRLTKLLSVLAGEASAFLSLAMNCKAAVDCRISQLPTEQLVVDYFRWRAEDAFRNSLNSHTYWLLRKQGHSARASDSIMRKMRNEDKHEALFKAGIVFGDLPGWQRSGTGLHWVEVPHQGHNPLTGEEVWVTRRRLHREPDLPRGKAYDEFLLRLIWEEPVRRSNHGFDTEAFRAAMAGPLPGY